MSICMVCTRLGTGSIVSICRLGCWIRSSYGLCLGSRGLLDEQAKVVFVLLPLLLQSCLLLGLALHHNLLLLVLLCLQRRLLLLPGFCKGLLVLKQFLLHLLS